MTKKFLRNVAFVTLLLGGFFLAFGNCFGKFALTRKVYGFNDSINIGGGIVARFFKTIIMYVFLILPIYGIAFLIDFIIINLIEFWTGNNLVGLNEYNEKGEYVKSMKYQDEEVKLTFSEYGAKLAMEVKKGDTNETFFAFRNQPNKIFKEVNGKMKEIEISSQTVGSKMILKMAEAGKLQSSKVVDVKDFQAIEKRYAAEVQ